VVIDGVTDLFAELDIFPRPNGCTRVHAHSGLTTILGSKIAHPNIALQRSYPADLGAEMLRVFKGT